jgi:hypothetical protein
VSCSLAANSQTTLRQLIPFPHPFASSLRSKRCDSLSPVWFLSLCCLLSPFEFPFAIGQTFPRKDIRKHPYCHCGLLIAASTFTRVLVRERSDVRITARRESISEFAAPTKFGLLSSTAMSASSVSAPATLTTADGDTACLSYQPLDPQSIEASVRSAKSGAVVSFVSPPPASLSRERAHAERAPSR